MKKHYPKGASPAPPIRGAEHELVELSIAQAKTFHLDQDLGLGLFFQGCTSFHQGEMNASWAQYQASSQILIQIHISGLLSLAACYPFVLSSRWFSQAANQPIARAASGLLLQERKACLERGKRLDFWETFADLISVLGEE